MQESADGSGGRGVLTHGARVGAASPAGAHAPAGFRFGWLLPALLLLAPAAARAQQPATRPDVEASRRTAIVLAAQRVAPAVVSVYVSRHERVQPRSLWESFFIPPGAQQEVSGLGSGFIVDPSGLVVTNEHVVRGAEQVVVTLESGRDVAAQVVGVDDVTDLALLRLKPPAGEKLDLPVAPIGDSDGLIIGEWVVALGNPFGFMLSNPEPTVTAGVVSGVHRNLVPTEEDSGFSLDMIQTDASINPGNSGGPLVNALGQVVGVNSSIISRSGGSEGLGFAIPIDRAMRIVADLRANGRVRRAWIGAAVEPAEPNRFGRSNTVRIASVAPGSPAAAAALRTGDVVVRVGGHDVRTPLDWEAALLDARVGSPVDVVVRRGGTARTLRVVPKDLPSVTAERIRALAGFELVTLTPQIRAERGLSSDAGALIVDLPEAARELGLRQGDLIVQINRTAIRSARDAAAALSTLSGGGAARMYVERNGQYLSTAFYVR